MQKIHPRISLSKKLDSIENLSDILESIKKQNISNYIDSSKRSGVDRLILLIFERAVELRASDIHIEPFDEYAIVRFRIDGALVEDLRFDLEVYLPLVSKVKILSGIDIAERRKAQDGRMDMYVLETDLDFRVSTLPTMNGESIAIRILDKKKAKMSLDGLGMSEKNLAKLIHIIQAPYGMVLLTGPTGSGKTTTLYALLNFIKSNDKKIITVEDPVEYKMSRIQQVQANDKAGLGFANALRFILRQDPDIIMIGEIRDEETMKIAIQASLTGHLVFSTLHTNDALSTIDRMLDMGVESYLVGSSVRAIISQRLLRCLCEECKQSIPVGSLSLALREYFDEFDTIYAPHGCLKCRNTGYYGREMICEILNISPKLATLIAKDAQKNKIISQAKEDGFRTLFEDGIDVVKSGKTSVEELLRVVWLETV